jgi:hypothetical protein
MGSDPSEWNSWPGESSQPPLVAAGPRLKKLVVPKKTVVEFSDEKGLTIVTDTAKWQDQVIRARAGQAQLKQELGATRRKATSEFISTMVPVIGGYVASIYDVVTGDSLAAAENIAEQGLVDTIDAMMKGGLAGRGLGILTAVRDVLNMGEALEAHDANVKKMEALELQEYRGKVGLKDPDAYFDRPYGRYLGPGGHVYEKSTNAPQRRIQGR